MIGHHDQRLASELPELTRRFREFNRTFKWVGNGTADAIANWPIA